MSSSHLARPLLRGSDRDYSRVMRSVMTLDNGRTGVRYELVVELVDGSWVASWRTLRPEGPGGRLTAADAYDAFKLASRAIEDIDEDVIGVDWEFHEPLPPWLDE